MRASAGPPARGSPSPLPPAQPLANPSPLSADLPVLDTSHQRSHTITGLLCVASFTGRSVSRLIHVGARVAPSSLLGWWFSCKCDPQLTQPPVHPGSPRLLPHVLLSAWGSREAVQAGCRPEEQTC